LDVCIFADNAGGFPAEFHYGWFKGFPCLAGNDGANGRGAGEVDFLDGGVVYKGRGYLCGVGWAVVYGVEASSGETSRV
jgi:hypothetical protein